MDQLTLTYTFIYISMLAIFFSLTTLDVDEMTTFGKSSEKKNHRYNAFSNHIDMGYIVNI